MGKGSDQEVGKGCGWLLAFALVLVGITKCAADDEAPLGLEGRQAAYVTASTLNCRQKPNRSSAVVDQLFHGERISFATEAGGWALIEE